MEIVFNELSFNPPFEDPVALKNKFLEMLDSYRQLKETFGVSKLLFPYGTTNCYVLTDVTFINWVSSLTSTSDKNKILLATTKKPFGEDILDEEKENINKYYYENLDLNIESEYCIGLAICLLKDKVAISLHSHHCWDESSITFKEIIDDDFNTNDVNVFNYCKSTNEIEENLYNKLLYYGALELKETTISPSKKNIKLSGDHHGNDKLKAFAKKLLHSKYVKEIINNIDFSPTTVRLIKKVYSDGTIDVILYWEDAGYGMKIKTTGRNYRETKEIARILRDEFDK